MIETDLIIIGAGPCGLFTVFEAGLLKLRCHLIDALPIPGGQCAEIYPKKPIYDIPGYPSILAGELVDNLMEQIKPFNPGFTLGERVESVEQDAEGMFTVTTNLQTVHKAPVVAIAGGLGCFEPRKPPISNIGDFETKGIDYVVKDPEKFRDKRVVISGGGDSALDWALFLADDVASEVSLVHRRSSFRGHPDSVDRVMNMAQEGKLNLITDSEVVNLHGNGHLQALEIKHKTEGTVSQELDYWLPLFGLSPALGPIADWGLNISKNSIEVDTLDYSTNVPGIYAIGDINTYPGKLKLILCGFHEATLMVQSAFKRVYPDKRLSFKYTTVMGGISGF
ncbi:MAG: NAD(P)/FAD-dependent oxidoreductase [Bacteroidota bacterium]